MPPVSQAPGGARGQACTLIVATRSGLTLFMRPSRTLERAKVGSYSVKGRPGRDRTFDISLIRRALLPLSYGPMLSKKYSIGSLTAWLARPYDSDRRVS